MKNLLIGKLYIIYKPNNRKKTQEVTSLESDITIEWITCEKITVHRLNNRKKTQQVTSPGSDITIEGITCEKSDPQTNEKKTLAVTSTLITKDSITIDGIAHKESDEKSKSFCCNTTSDKDQ